MLQYKNRTLVMYESNKGKTKAYEEKNMLSNYVMLRPLYYYKFRLLG